MLSIISGSVLLGLQYALLALGVYITFRILNIPDLTVDGSFTFGIAVSSVMCYNGHPFLGILFAVLAGLFAGIVTGLLQTKAGIHPILAGILTMSGLYTVNITVMGAPNVSLIGKTRFYDFLSKLMSAVSKDVPKIILITLICIAAVILLILFFKTVLGLCIRATGNNEDMVRASSINTKFTKITALAISNALVALSGALITQTQGYADVNSGSGMIVVGLASVIIGEVIFGKRSLNLGLISAVVGSIIYRLIIAFALESNVFSANALKLISALIVAITLSIPSIKKALENNKLKKEGLRNA